MISANQIEVWHGYTGVSRGLSEAPSKAYIEKATNTTAIKTPVLAADAPMGNYAIYVQSMIDKGMLCMQRF